jgi:MazG family protein
MIEVKGLIDIVARLRGEQGCPWDKAQTAKSMRPYLLEEAYEVLEALDKGDPALLRKELGDLLFQIVFLARTAEEAGDFTFADVVQGISDKMIHRHPHVFDPDYAASGDEGELEAWEARKAKERKDTGSALDGVPQNLPALLRAHRISEKASRVGFDWKERSGVLAKLEEELGELHEALESEEPEHITEEFGDVLFTLVNLGRRLPATAEDALRTATDRFSDRFRDLEKSLDADGMSVHTTDLDILEERWRAVKRPPSC